MLLADMKGETKRYRSIWRSILVKSFEILQWIAAGNGVGAYDHANREMLSAFCKNHHPDGEIVFLAADPACKMKGVGSALLSALEAEVHGKQIYLYTDNACTYQFYERSGFEKSEEREILRVTKVARRARENRTKPAFTLLPPCGIVWDSGTKCAFRRAVTTGL